MRIGNNGGGNSNDLRGMRRNAKSLKRNEGEGEAILIAPLKLPRFSARLKFLSSRVHQRLRNGQSASGRNPAARMASLLKIPLCTFTKDSANDTSIGSCHWSDRQKIYALR